MELYQLYKERTSSVITPEEFREEVAYLTSLGWSGESLFFSINFCSKHYREELTESFSKTLDRRQGELLKYYELAVSKRAIKQYEERIEKYDSKNELKRDNKPSWFRKGVNFSLFE